MKEWLISVGYAEEIDWQDCRDLADISDCDLVKEAAWVIIACGMSDHAVRSVFPKVTDAFLGWQSVDAVLTARDACKAKALDVFNNPRKVDAILTFAEFVRDTGTAAVKSRLVDLGPQVLNHLPFMGPATGMHLGKNIGLPLAKPDRHLTRLATGLGFESPAALCDLLANLTGDKPAVVDTVLWRFATLKPNYVDFFRNNLASDEGTSLCALPAGEPRAGPVADEHQAQPCP